MKYLGCVLFTAFPLLFGPTSFSSSSDSADDTTLMDDVEDDGTGNSVKLNLCLSEGHETTTVSCTLSNGTTTQCYQIVSKSTPADCQMGPWCPDNIADGAEAEGLWLENGEVYDVEGTFIQNMATYYNDSNWFMYASNRDIYTTDTEEDRCNAANPNVGAEYENFCVECLPSYMANISQTYLIPTTREKLDSPVSLGGVGPGQNSPSVQGIAFNGVRFGAPAPIDAILGAYTLAPFDDPEVYITLNAGHHYHVEALGTNSFIDCLADAYSN